MNSISIREWILINKRPSGVAGLVVHIPIHGDLGLDVETWLVWALNIGKASFIYKFTKGMRNG